MPHQDAPDNARLGQSKSDGSISRELLRRGNFTSKAHLQQRIEGFIAYFNATMAKPFSWTMKGKPLVA